MKRVVVTFTAVGNLDWICLAWFSRRGHYRIVTVAPVKENWNHEETLHTYRIRHHRSGVIEM